MAFPYDKEVTREVCRNCSDRYEDFYYADNSGMCDDCMVNTGHLGMTNLPQILDEDAKSLRESQIKALTR